MRKLLLPLILALTSETIQAAGPDPYAMLRKFHPVERVVKEQSQPLVSGSPGHATFHYTYRWLRTFKFSKSSHSLLVTLRKMAIRVDGKIYKPYGGEYMEIKMPNGRNGIYMFKTKTLSLDDEPVPAKKSFNGG